MRVFDAVILLIAVIAGLLISMVSLDIALSVFIGIIGAWLVYIGISKREKPLTGVFSKPAVCMWWGGFLLSISVALPIRNLQPQIPLSVFIAGITITLILASKLEKK
jgi:hypothetical protein